MTHNTQARTPLSVADCAEHITATFEDVHRTVQGWIETVLNAFADSTPHAKELDELVALLVRSELDRRRDTLIGAGFVAAPGLIPDAPWHLAWWLGERNTFEMNAGAPRIRPLLTVDDPGADGFRDYTALEWWRVPAETERMHITGPYVDYLCTDDYTMTMTVPVIRDGQLIGMMGVDQYVTDLERDLLPRMISTGIELTLINAFGRVILSTNPNTATGTLLRDEALERELAVRENADSPQRTELMSGDVLWRCGTTTLCLVEHSA